MEEWREVVREKVRGNERVSEEEEGYIYIYIYRKGLFRYQVFLYRAFILEQSSLDEMKGI